MPEPRPDPGSSPTPATGGDAGDRLARAVPRWAVIGTFLILAVHALAYARMFLMPLVLALLLTLVFSPLRRFLSRLGLPSGLAALMIVGALIAGLMVGVATLATPASRWVENAPIIGLQLRQKISEMRGATEDMRQAAEAIERLADGGGGESASDADDDEVQRVRVEDQGMINRVALTAPAALAQMLFTLVLLFFLLASGDMFYEKTVTVMPTFRDKRRAIRIAHDIERKLSRYFFTITVINAGLGVAVGFAMWALGMPNPALFGVIAALLNFIPYIGAVLGVALAFAVALVSLDQASDAFVAAGVYLGLTALEGQIATPYFVGRRLQLNTVVVFLSVSLWAWLWSVVGMLVATPLLVALRTLSEHVPALEPLGTFLSGPGAERKESDDTQNTAPD